MNEKVLKIRNKVEDGIVKVYNWTKAHPILTSIGISVIGAGIGGAVAYKTGYSRGDDFARKDIGRKIHEGCENITLTCEEEGRYYDKEFALGIHDVVEETDPARLNLLTGAMAMKLDTGDAALVYKPDADSVDVFAIEKHADRVNEVIDSLFDDVYHE